MIVLENGDRLQVKMNIAIGAFIGKKDLKKKILFAWKITEYQKIKSWNWQRRTENNKKWEQLVEESIASTNNGVHYECRTCKKWL